ncbi:hypothetical protein [Macrococcus bovicus]|uniref:Uncharacterized protein n=1 Tax=Macrococcus bovicus TaxID=69968 RepID=A0A4V6PPV9_9STAP|nr:hypothetical protein [Macrococcus bovicus]TDM15609.1 hypothetical protein ERX55_01505 [Macrococcus bovicus]
MSDWVRTHDGRSLYRTAEGDLIDLTNAPPDLVRDMVRARREERKAKNTSLYNQSTKTAENITDKETGQ